VSDYTNPALISIDVITRMRAGDDVEAHNTLRLLSSESDLAAYIDAQNAVINTFADEIDRCASADGGHDSAYILGRIRQGLIDGMLGDGQQHD